jgi:tRNA (cytidine/uridine-2'-O-)-methyltransferase
MLHVVLFEPEIPPNTGNIIRLCANAGAVLHLIKPLGFRLDDKSLQRSGLDYHDLAEMRVHADLAAFEAACPQLRLLAVETGAAQRYSDVRFREHDALLFGPETRGLPAAVLERLGSARCMSIPMSSCTRSINLANAAALVLFEAWRQLGFRGADSAANASAF